MYATLYVAFLAFLSDIVVFLGGRATVTAGNTTWYQKLGRIG